jgi:hypothetical protein
MTLLKLSVLNQTCSLFSVHAVSFYCRLRAIVVKNVPLTKIFMKLSGCGKKFVQNLRDFVSC